MISSEKEDKSTGPRKPSQLGGLSQGGASGFPSTRFLFPTRRFSILVYPARRFRDSFPFRQRVASDGFKFALLSSIGFSINCQ